VNGNRPSSSRGVPVEEFLAAIGEQLDRAQDALAIKARTGRPLTWALRDMKLALQIFVDVDPQGHVTWRNAGPNETGASTVNLEFTTITRPMIEENTYAMQDDSDARPLDTLGAAAELSDEDKLRLRRLGVRTVGQFRRLSPAGSGQSGLAAIGDMVNIPVSKLEAALRASARPSITSHEAIRRSDETLLRVRGANLSDGINTEVRLGGDPVEVLEARPHELLVRPLEHHRAGQIEVVVNGERATSFFRLPHSPGANGSNANGASGVDHEAAGGGVP
jgi:hypothetical protein